MSEQRLGYAEHVAFFQRQQLYRKRTQLERTSGATETANVVVTSGPSDAQESVQPQAEDLHDTPAAAAPTSPTGAPLQAPPTPGTGPAAPPPQPAPTATKKFPVPGSVDNTIRLRLRVAAGPDAGVAFSLPEGEFVIGRAPEAELRLTDDTVSHQHAKFVITSQRATIEDLGSLNGTQLDPVTSAGPVALRGIAILNFGDRVRMAQTELVVGPGDQRG
jgi:hypothetical protein